MAEQSNLQSISQDVAAAVAAAAPGVVRVSGRCWPATGVAWSADGLVVTTARAVGNRAETVTVGVGDDEHEARVIGRDPDLDLALLRIDGVTLQPLEFAGADDLAVGQLVLALGRPGRSVRASLRIIGVLGPEVQTRSGSRIDRYIESDRRIPRGFSGGPLIAADGRAVGIDTRAVIRGADLALPRATVERVVANLLAHGTVRRGYLGIGAYPVDLPGKVAEELGAERGALIVAVAEDSPAEAAGLLVGDIVVAIAGDAVSRPGHIRAALNDRADQEVEIRVVRAGAVQDVKVTVGSRE